MNSHFQRGKYKDELHMIGPSLDSIDRAYDLLLNLPDQDAVAFFTIRDHEEAWKQQQLDQAGWYLFLDSYNWLKFFWYTSIFKTRQLIESLIHSYNSSNHLAWLILARSSLEYVAITFYFAKKISMLDLQGPYFSLSQLKAFEDLALQYAHSSRFDWSSFMNGDLPKLHQKFNPEASMKAVNIMTALDHLAKRDDRYKDVRIGYDLLSDFAHPNMASHSAVAEMPIAAEQRHEVKLSVHPAAPRGEFLMVMSLPWVSMGIGTTVEILVDLTRLMDIWLGYLDHGDKISIDPTK